MLCPLCGHSATRVVDSRPTEGGAVIRRRRCCESCGARFTTHERVASVRMVRKRDGRLEPFAPEKLRRGVEAALAGRRVSQESIEDLVLAIETEVQGISGVVGTDAIGRMVLERLRHLDEVASVRFASVYKGFQGVRDFARELAELDSVNRPE